MSQSSHKPFKDYFDILGIEADATDEQVKAAYRERAFLVHPDRNSSQEAHEKFLELGEAYHVLSNPDMRRRYMNRYFAQSPKNQDERLKQAIQQRQELTRMKRADRYRAGRYTQRMRYRGSTTSRTSKSPWEAGNPAPRRPYRPQTVHSDALEADVESTQVGFRIYSWLMSAVAVAIILLCGGMWTDFYLSKDLPEEVVKNRRRSSEIFVAMNGMKIKTTRHSFLVHGEEARKMPKGRAVTLMKSPFGRILTHVKVMEDNFEWKFRVLDGPYGIHYWMTYVVAFFSLLTLLLRKKYQSSAYVGTVNILLALSMLSMVFTT